MAENHRDRRSRSGSSPAVGIVAFLLGFLFAFIVLFGSIFGVGYVAVTTDINEVFRVFGLENVKEEVDPEDPDADKYNYINADQAPNIYTLITEVMKMANEGLGEINLSKIDALAPVTDTVLNLAYGFIDEVVDFDKEYFENVPLTSIIDVVKNSMYYVRMSKIIETLNTKMGYQVSLSSIPMVDYLIDGVEAQYATVKGKDENFRLPVLYDYYVHSEDSIEYCRQQPDSGGTSAYPANLNGSGDDYSFIHDTTLKDSSGNKLYRVYYVPCKVTESGIEEADYEIKINKQEDANVNFSKNGETVKLKYGFRTVEFGADTDFIAVKPKMVDGMETFTLDHEAIFATKNSDANADASNRYVGYSYYDKYAREYFTGPQNREENDLIYGVSTVNHINFFKNVAGEVIEYDPLLVSDFMLDALMPLNNVPIASVVNTDQAETIRGIFGDTSLGAVLSQNVNFNELIDDVKLSTFMRDVKVDDKIMTYLVYNLSSIRQDEAGNYTAIYDRDGEKILVNLEVEDGKIKSITDAERGEELKGNSVSDMNGITDGLTLDVFMDVKADEAIISYLGYGVSQIKAEAGTDSLNNAYTHTAKYKIESADGTAEPVQVDCYLTADENGIVERAWYVDNGAVVEIEGTKVTQIDERINKLQDTLTIGELVEVTDDSSRILQSIKDTTITGLDGRINTLTVKEVLEPDQISNNSVLPQLKDTKITELGTEIDRVLIQRIYADSIYKVAKDSDPMPVVDYTAGWTYYTKVDGALTEVTLSSAADMEAGKEYFTYGTDTGEGATLKLVGFNSSYLYYELNENGAYVLTEVNSASLPEGDDKDNAVGKLTQDQWNGRGDKQYYSYGQAKGMWRLILYRVDGSTKTEKAYTLNNFNNMVAACGQTVNNSTLGELKEAGIISVEEGSLNKKLRVVTGSLPNIEVKYIKIDNAGNVTTVANAADATTMKDLTLKQLVEAVTTYAE